MLRRSKTSQAIAGGAPLPNDLLHVAVLILHTHDVGDLSNVRAAAQAWILPPPVRNTALRARGDHPGALAVFIANPDEALDRNVSRPNEEDVESLLIDDARATTRRG